MKLLIRQSRCGFNYKIKFSFPDLSRVREEIEENTATQVPRAAGKAVRTLGPV